MKKITQTEFSGNLAAFGIHARNQAGDLLPLAVILEEISNKWDTFAQHEKNQIAHIITDITYTIVTYEQSQEETIAQ